MENLDPIELKIRHFISEFNDEAVELLKEVVNVNSGSFNLKGVKSVGDIFSREFQKLGFMTEWIPGDAWQRAGHLIAKKSWQGS